jgi:hypothetical protein
MKTLKALLNRSNNMSQEEQRRNYNRNYYLIHRDQELKWQKAYRLNHINQIKKYRRDYQIKNKEEISAKGKMFYLNNKEILKERSRIYNETHREKRNATHRAYYQANRDKIRIQAKAYYLNHCQQLRIKQKIRHLQSKYGMNQKDFEILFASQNNRCAICKTRDWDKHGPEIDHNHKTGAVRGILCHQCNMGIGFLRENINIARELIHYLVKYNQQNNEEIVKKEVL